MYEVMYHLITNVTEDDVLWERIRRRWSSLPSGLVIMHCYGLIGRLCGAADMVLSHWLEWLGAVCAVGASVSAPSKFVFSMIG